MTTREYPYTIDNGAGEQLTFLRRVPGPNGDRLEVRNVVKPGSGPPMHTHNYQDEALTVESGRMSYQHLGREPQEGGPGDTVVFKAGEPHRFWNSGDTDLHCTGFIEPPDNIEYFLSELYASTKRGGKGRPDPFDAAFLVMRYRSEFGMAAIPAPVQRLVFPLLIALGRVLGRYRRYSNAPEPVRR